MYEACLAQVWHTALEEDKRYELPSLSGEMMADYEQNRRSSANDGGDISAIFSSNMWQKNNQ